MSEDDLDLRIISWTDASLVQDWDRSICPGPSDPGHPSGRLVQHPENKGAFGAWRRADTTRHGEGEVSRLFVRRGIRR